MVIDNSALLAILLDEPERRRFHKMIEADPVRLLSAARNCATSLGMADQDGGEPWGSEPGAFAAADVAPGIAHGGSGTAATRSRMPSLHAAHRSAK